MKKLIFLLFVSLQALALTESVHGTGYSSGFCRGDGFASFCVTQLEDRAKSDAARAADLQCQVRQGNLLTYTGSCFGNCNPFFIPEGQDTYVNCNSNCRYECDIRNP